MHNFISSHITRIIHPVRQNKIFFPTSSTNLKLQKNKNGKSADTPFAPLNPSDFRNRYFDTNIKK
jgi:hypothetical protein